MSPGHGCEVRGTSHLINGNPASEMRGGWVYLLASRYRGTIYTGVTADLARRTYQHRTGKGSKFAAKYEAVRLVHAEHYPRIDEAIAREKAIKKWLRQWKIADRERQSRLAGYV